ncbi:MAG: ParB/RepB/Spo0J family partition protein [Candidatus Zixiibacteriota bacterium]
MTVKEEVREIELSHIRVTQGPDRLRDIDTLAKSIAAVGLQIPLIVQHIPDGGDTKGNEKYLLVDGHRRFAALQKNKVKTVRVIEIAEDMPGDKMQTIQLTANLHRLQLTAFEEAAAIKRLRDDGRETKDIAADLGLTPQAVARREQLNKLTPEWMKYIRDMREGKALSVAAFEMIASYEPSVQGKLLQSYSKSSNVPTVNDVKRELSAFDRTLKSAPWKLDDALLFPAAGACNACPKRSSCQSLLFDGEVDGKKASPEDKCLDIACWNKKLEKFGRLKIDEAKVKHPNLVLIAKSGWGSDTKIATGVSRGQKIFKVGAYGDKEYEPAKKSDKDAVPAMRVNEVGFGAVTYVKIKKETKAAAPTKQAAKQMTPEEISKQQADALKSRRAEWIKDKIEDGFGWDSKAPKRLHAMKAEEILLLLGSLYISSGDMDYKGIEKWQKLDRSKSLDAVWKAVMEQIWLPDDFSQILSLAKHILGLDVAALEAEAIKAIPDPQPKAGAKKERKE